MATPDDEAGNPADVTSRNHPVPAVTPVGASGEDASYDVTKKWKSVNEKGRFVIPWPNTPSITLWKAAMWMLTRGQKMPGEEALDAELPITKPNFSSGVPANQLGHKITWIGHATVLVEIDGINVLTDPMFSERASMFQWAGPWRYRKPACRVDDLPRIDAVVISHNHYDHLDRKSVNAINKKARYSGNAVTWFVPLGLSSWMNDNGCSEVRELDWWEEQDLCKDDGVTVKFALTPAQHWCKRALNDDNKVLWGSWCVIGPRNRFFFAGDTGYEPSVFKSIGHHYGPFNSAAIPIGAYEPRDLMKHQHVNPEEAVMIHEDVKSNKSIAIHWGTFNLSDEHYLAPRKDLHMALTAKELSSTDFITLRHGQTETFETNT